MDRFAALEIFVRVVETGSFSGAAAGLAVSQSTVSKQIAELERQLQTTLLSRTTRQLNVTESGDRFYHQAKQILEQYSKALGEAGTTRMEPSGTLRMASPILLGRKQLTPLLPRFFQRYPNIRVEHYLSDSPTDLVREGIDLSIRVGEMKDSTNLARKLGALRPVTVATKAFLEAHPPIRHPADLAGVPCLIYLRHPTPFVWNFSSADEEKIDIAVDGPYRVDVFEALCDAAMAGLGVLRAPLSACGEELAAGTLQEVLPEYNGKSVPIYAVMPLASYIPHKTRVMVDFLADEFAKNPWLHSLD